MDNDTYYWLVLSLIFPVASTELYHLYELYGSSEEIFNQLKKMNTGKFLPEERQRLFSSQTLGYAEKIADFCQRHNIRVISPGSSFYPCMLKNISDPPIIIYAAGNIQCLDNKNSAAIVGARHAEKYSLDCAEKFAFVCAENDITVVSGFAVGTDTAAHNGALKADGKTIAVLGSGICYDYPSGTMNFKKAISVNGAVISEYPPLAAPEPVNFKVRNRLISGLSKAVLVAEAGSKSGALNTASHALDQGRDVYVIPPHDIFSRKFAGQISLINDGAEVVYSPCEFIGKVKEAF